MLSGLTYKAAGVDIAAGDAFVEKIKGFAKRTTRPEVMAGLGGFGAAFAPNLGDYSDPVLVSGTDGVGTKLLLAQAAKKHNTVGVDLVAMCVNDILVLGAEPLFFLDYLATGKLEPEVLASVVEGVSEGCVQAGCALVGGETAELPHLYPDGVYDLAGFAVGMVDRPKICSAERVRAGDTLIGLSSSGVHSNGYSLVRKVIRDRGYDLESSPAELSGTLGDALLVPTRIYVKPVLAVMKEHSISAMAHITGGGIPGNLARVLPEGLSATVDLSSFPRPEVFSWLLAEGVPVREALDVFNMGLGMILVVPGGSAGGVLDAFSSLGCPAFEVGRVEEGGNGVRVDGVD